MKKYAVIVAGGSGERMGGAVPKQFLLLAGKSLLWHSVNAFVNCYPDIRIIIVLPAEHMQTGEEGIEGITVPHPVIFTEGGATRFHSVQNGLKHVSESSVIFVHDAVRCLLTSALIERCYVQAVEKGSAIPAVAATDSIRIVEGHTNRPADRNFVRIIQTPQTFSSTLLLPAFRASYREEFTDEATVLEAYGSKVELVEGEHDNIKITRPTDMMIAESIIAERSKSATV